MLYKRFRKEKKKGTFLPILIPVMNLFLLILPFVIQNAFLQKIASMELQLPSVSDSPANAFQSDAGRDIVIEIKREGLSLFLGDARHMNVDFSEGYEQRLYNKLLELKNELPKKQEIVIKIDPLIQYEKVIKVIDICKSEGKLFPNVVYYDEVK